MSKVVFRYRQPERISSKLGKHEIRKSKDRGKPHSKPIRIEIADRVVLAEAVDVEAALFPKGVAGEPAHKRRRVEPVAVVDEPRLVVVVLRGEAVRERVRERTRRRERPPEGVVGVRGDDGTLRVDVLHHVPICVVEWNV